MKKEYFPGIVDSAPWPKISHIFTRKLEMFSTGSTTSCLTTLEGENVSWAVLSRVHHKLSLSCSPPIENSKAKLRWNTWQPLCDSSAR